VKVGSLVGALTLVGALALSTAAPADARVRHVWVAAVPTSWNVAPTGYDPISGEEVDPAEAIFGTVVYRRYSRRWKRPLANAPRSSQDGLLVPGPLIRARVGDHLRIHFKNMDKLRKDPHSMHFHGVHYRPSSDGAYLPGFSGRDGNVKFGKSYTYRLTAGRDSVGAWPYHDHSPSMEDSIHGGLFGMLSILGRRERAPDREFVVVFSPFGKDFMTINGRAFVGNTPLFRARPGELVQWDVMAMGSEHHTFHVHGHRWRGPGGHSRDTQTVGPAESFRIRWREDAPGTWLYHCHVEDHMMRGMIGTYRVSRRRR
jgi:FtsP/CotA-like multicopper oxidase with cupredoxin domain